MIPSSADCSLFNLSKNEIPNRQNVSLFGTLILSNKKYNDCSISVPDK